MRLPGFGLGLGKVGLAILLAVVSPASAQDNILTIWEHPNASQGRNLAVPRQDPSKGYPAMQEVERGRLETAIIKAQRNLQAAQQNWQRERLLIILEELERRLGILNKNPNRYFALYPYVPPEEE
ncbi:MAG: hypothetical protein LDL30_09825 [Desulfovibrio sp.]|nr:hypothetical protein [Desulfovibrio sp.]MCA1987066.1 hypothetical protein [Desulfovibrio sp.]